ncbi:preprotein translocase subunit YajC [Nonomuraea endophytica]|uniref:Preprotein translocase subunit YajC n=1 Tax=Nonomuraea endophytica TaxID=714136 RepID=A0A7W8A3K4_9ACTN|nr:preprotein translocase subunit YajC [Nonomuraea endophytica]MBB5077718.1 preprotein translocase subunit YajC [Nonomuraea endophytica]
MGSLGSILPLVLLVVVFYFLLIRPQRKRQQEAVKMQNSLTPGTRVMTTTGLFATVVTVDNEDVILEVAPGIETRWVKAAIGRVVTPGDAPVEDEPVADEPVADVADEVKTEDVKDETKNGDSSTKQS